MTKNMYLRSGVLLVLLTFVVVLFQNCSAGGGAGAGGGAATATVISGAAVAGAPIIGAVTIKDSAGVTKFSTIEANGNYSIDVTGLAPPFMLRAEGSVGGRSYSIFSAATLADINGHINVTPLTDLIVANIAGQLASTFFNSGSFAMLTTSELNSQTAALQARLLPILSAAGVSGSIDLLRSSFAVDHTGLDAALDVLRVDYTGSSATITSIINGFSITDDVTVKTDTTVIDATGVSAGLTDFQLVVAGFTTFANLFKVSVPLPSNPALVALFDPGFLMDGETRTQFLSEITTDSSMIGLSFSNISIVPGSVGPTSMKVSFVVIQGGTPQDDMVFEMVKSGGNWLINGNGRLYRAQARTFARLQDVYISSLPVVNNIDTGLYFPIDDKTALGADYAIVTGPGLPVGGALYFNEGTGNSFEVAPLGGAYLGTSTVHFNTYGHGQIPMSDVDIALIPDNSTYTIVLWEDNGTNSFSGDTVRATYTEKLSKRPYLNSELSIASFAPILSLDRPALFAFGSAGGTFPVSWTIPSGLRSRELAYFRSGNGSGTSTTDVQTQVAGTVTSSSITGLAAIDTSSSAFGALQASGINLFMADSYGRELVTIRNGTYVGGPFYGL